MLGSIKVNAVKARLTTEPIRSELFEKVNDPGGGGFKSLPPSLRPPKTIASIVTISFMRILLGV